LSTHRCSKIVKNLGKKIVKYHGCTSEYFKERLKYHVWKAHKTLDLKGAIDQKVKQENSKTSWLTSECFG
jgi:transposase